MTLLGKTIRLIGLANGVAHALDGQYIVSYDPEYHLADGGYDGGKLVTTPHLEDATRFDFKEALKLWMSGPTCDCHRLRPDGGENRPLRAFNAEIS